MRYFQTSNATRLFRIGQFSFKFDPVGLFSGNWVGILATDKEDEAEALAGFGPLIVETNEASYNDLKKKDPPSLVNQEAPQVLTGVVREEKPVAESLDEEISVGKATYTDPLDVEQAV